MTVVSSPLQPGDLESLGYSGPDIRWVTAPDAILSELRRDLADLGSLVSWIGACVRSGQFCFVRIDGEDDEEPPPQRYFVCFGGHPERDPAVISLRMRPVHGIQSRPVQFRSPVGGQVQSDLRWLAGVRFGPLVFPPRILDDVYLDQFEARFDRKKPKMAEDLYLLQADYWGGATFVSPNGAIVHWHRSLGETCSPSSLEYREWLAEQVQIPAVPRPRPIWQKG